MDAEVVTKKNVDGGGIDKHITQDIYNSAGSAIAKTYWYHENSRGDTVAITNETGDTLQKIEYSSYGEVFQVNNSGNLEPFQNTLEITYKFQGREFDEESGLIYFRNRYFSATQGRFLQVDPLAYHDCLNLHQAMGGNPGNVLDPMGEDVIDQKSFTPFIESVKAYGIPTKFLEKLSGKVSFGFHENLLYGSPSEPAQYIPGLNKVYVRADVYTVKTGYLSLSPSQTSRVDMYSLPSVEESIQREMRMEDGAEKFSKIMHELWHAYLENVIKKDPCLKSEWDYLVAIAPSGIKVRGATDKAEVELTTIKRIDEYFDEAVGNKIESLMKILVESSANSRKKWSYDFKKNWNGSYNSEFDGYISEEGVYRPSVVEKKSHPKLFSFMKKHIFEIEDGD